MTVPIPPPDHRPLVVIVGAGFGGLKLARLLRRDPVRVLLLDRRNYHLFQPLLYQVATAGLSPSDIAHPVRSILRRQHNLSFCMAEVRRVDLAGRRLETSLGTLHYDYLILAVGSETSYFGLESIARNSFGLKDIHEATAIRNHILRMFELAVWEPDPRRRSAMLTLAVAGGGPTGVECAGALAELVRLVLARDFRGFNLDDTRILLLEASHQILTGFPAELQEEARRELLRKHVTVRTGAAVSAYRDGEIHLAGGERIPAGTLIWAAGVRAAAIAETLGVPLTRNGRIIVEPTLQLASHPEVFVIGDAAAVKPLERQLPMMAPVALQQARLTAANLRRLLSGKPLESFVYRDPGSLATIGRNAAVARLGRFRFHGFAAWVLWLVVHLIQLIGFRNRLLVLINWAWDYLFYDRAVRLIMPDPRRPD